MDSAAQGSVSADWTQPVEGLPPHPTVFVVDDEPGIIRLCRRLLERAGFQVITFTDPQLALTSLRSETTDLLLVDIRMPGIDGFQLINVARHHHPDLAVVVMTGFGTVETAIEALRQGADGLILKPFSGAEMVDSVRRALQQSQHKQDVLRLQALRPLFDVTKTLFSETNPRRLQNLLLEAVCGHLECNHAEYYQVHISDHNRPPRLRLSTSLHLTAAKVITEQRSASAFLTEPIARQAEKLRSPFRINAEDTGQSPYVEILNQRNLGSIMCAPVRLSEDSISGGVLLAARDCQESRFRESDLELLTILARQAAVALENARLHAELHEYIQQLEASQRALVQAEKMAIAGRLTASIAHEINNPLQAVQNCLHLAGRMELHDEQRLNYLELAKGELERLMHTVQRMLDFYRPAALDRKPANINIIIEKALSLLSKQLSDHNITPHLHLANVLPFVLAVSDQIQQVILNLTLNAMEAMLNGGDIYIGTVIIGDGNTREVEIIIEDNGPGVPVNERKHIFEPFVSTKEKGTGLGLAVSYGIITAHGGSLDLIDGPRYSNKAGACFRITLPIEEHT